MPRRDEERSRGAMSVEYALMLVLVMGLVSTGIGLALKGTLASFNLCLQGELTGSGCEDATTTPPSGGSGGSNSAGSPVTPVTCPEVPGSGDPSEASNTTPPTDEPAPDPGATPCVSEP